MGHWNIPRCSQWLSSIFRQEYRYHCGKSFVVSMRYSHRYSFEHQPLCWNIFQRDDVATTKTRAWSDISKSVLHAACRKIFLAQSGDDFFHRQNDMWLNALACYYNIAALLARKWFFSPLFHASHESVGVDMYYLKVPALPSFQCSIMQQPFFKFSQGQSETLFS